MVEYRDDSSSMEFEDQYLDENGQLVSDGLDGNQANNGNPIDPFEASIREERFEAFRNALRAPARVNSGVSMPE